VSEVSIVGPESGERVLPSVRILEDGAAGPATTFTGAPPDHESSMD
jgi:hypothetical protein